MAWVFLEAINFSLKFLGLSVGIFKNFRDCFWIVRAEFFGLFSNSRDKILVLNIRNFWDRFWAVPDWVEVWF